MNSEPVIVERTFNVPATRIWKAITDKNEMKKWYFNLAEFKPEIGFEFTFNGGPSDKVYVHLCKITEVEYCKRLTYSWRYKGYVGNSFVTWELFAEGEYKTRLKLTHSGLETFPANNPDFAKHNFVEGWTHFIGTSLKEYLSA